MGELGDMSRFDHGHVGEDAEAAHAAGVVVEPQHVLFESGIAEIAVVFNRSMAVLGFGFEQHFGLRFEEVFEKAVRVGRRIDLLFFGEEVFE